MKKRLGDLYGSLPRAARWAVWAGALVVGFLVVDSYLLKAYDRWNQRATQLEGRLARLKALGDTDSEQGRTIQVGVSSFGQPSFPGASSKTVSALTSRVNAVFDAAGINDRTQIERRATLAVRGTGERYERIMLEVTFESTADELASILADLEASPEVTTVSRVRVDRAAARGSSAGSGAMRTTVVAEAWAQPQGGA